MFRISYVYIYAYKSSDLKAGNRACTRRTRIVEVGYPKWDNVFPINPKIFPTLIASGSWKETQKFQ